MHNHEVIENVSPLRRLLTQNLIVSATTAVASPRAAATWEQVTDLATAVDVYVLFDEAHVLGRCSNVHDLPATEFTELVREFTRADYLAAADERSVANVASAHFRTYLETLDARDLLMTAQFGKDRDYAWWRQTFGDDVELHALATGDWPSLPLSQYESYYARTFLYLGYADYTRTSLTVDARRAEAVEHVASAETALATRIINIIKQTYSETIHDGYEDVRQRISPFAAVVFARAASKGTSVPAEIRRLRDEVSPTRHRLRTATHELAHGTYVGAQRYEKEWQDVATEVTRAFGLEPEIVSVRQALNFAPTIAALADASKSAKSWIDTILALPVDMLRRSLARRPIIEIHRMKGDLPTGGKLYGSIEKLFGVRPGRVTA